MPLFFNMSIAVHNDPVASKEWGWVQVGKGRGRAPVAVVVVYSGLVGFVLTFSFGIGLWGASPARPACPCHGRAVNCAQRGTVRDLCWDHPSESRLQANGRCRAGCSGWREHLASCRGQLSAALRLPKP